MHADERKPEEEALRDVAPPEFAAPEPARKRMLQRAYQRARGGGPGAGAGRLSGRRALLGVTLAAAAVALVLAVLLRPSARPDETPGAAWAKTEGYIVDFDLLQVPVTQEELGVEEPDLADWLLGLSDGEIAERGLDAYPQLLIHELKESNSQSFWGNCWLELLWALMHWGVYHYLMVSL